MKSMSVLERMSNSKTILDFLKSVFGNEDTDFELGIYNFG